MASEPFWNIRCCAVRKLSAPPRMMIKTTMAMSSSVMVNPCLVRMCSSFMGRRS